MLSLDTLEPRRLYFDLIMCYTIVFNVVKLEFADFFTCNPVTVACGHLGVYLFLFPEIILGKHFSLILLVNLGIICLLMLLTSAR